MVIPDPVERRCGDCGRLYQELVNKPGDDLGLCGRCAIERLSEPVRRQALREWDFFIERVPASAPASPSADAPIVVS